MLVDRDIESDDVDTPEEDHSINTELAELTKYVEMITNTVRDMESPVTTTSDQLPQATAHLNDLAKLTEEGTHRVLALTEAMETNRVAMQTALDNYKKKFGNEHSTDLEQLVTW